MNTKDNLGDAKQLNIRIRNITLTVLAALLLAFYLILCMMSLHLISRSTTTQYETDCQHIAKAYSHSISELINRYLSDLRVFSTADIFKTGTEAQIISWIHAHDDRRPPYFDNLYYADADGHVYSSIGKTAEISDRGYFKDIMANGKETAVDGGSISRTTGQLVIHVARAVYNAEGKRIGIIGGSVSLATIQEAIRNIRIGDSGYAFIINSEGQFISYPDSSLLFKRNGSLVAGTGETSISYMLGRRSGYLKTTSVKGIPIAIAFEPIEGTPCILGITIPETQVTQLYTSVRNTQTTIFFIMILGILLCIVIEMTVLRLLNERFCKAAEYDQLTKVYTTPRFEEAAQQFIGRHPGGLFMLFDADIRGFKILNQTYGTDRTDQMLVLFAKALNDSSSKYDGFIGRGYADRFYGIFLIANEHKSMNTFREELKKVTAAIKTSEITFYIKFGIAFSHQDDKDVTVKDLVGKASFAKSTIKNNLIYQFAVFTPEMQRHIYEVQQIEGCMENAIEKEEFFVMYQPKISLKTEKMAGAEALVRWNNPKFGVMSPLKFIPVFERNSFIVTLDFYVYDKVFQFLQHQIDCHNPVVPISVNMSRNHTNPEQFMRQFLDLFHKYSVPPSLIEVEIIERTSDTGKLMLLETTKLLHKNGFNVAMDDFGSGESSLNMLSTIPVDVIKFDQTFLKPDEYTDKTSGLITKLVELGKQLDKETIFEGVETKEQINFLKSIHCDEVQGYYYSRPLSEKDFIAYTKEHL